MAPEMWRRLSVRANATRVQDALVGGVPPYLRSQLIAWLQYYYIGDVGPDSLPSVQHLKTLELRLKKALDWGDQSNNYITAHQSLLAHLARGDVATDVPGALFHRHHRGPGDRPVAPGRTTPGLAPRSGVIGHRLEGGRMSSSLPVRGVSVRSARAGGTPSRPSQSARTAR